METLGSLLLKKINCYLMICQTSYEICIQGRTNLLTRTNTLLKKRYIVAFNFVMMNKNWSLFLADSENKLVYYLDPLQASCFDKKMAQRK